MDLINVEITTDRLLLAALSFKYKKDIFSEFTEEITTYLYSRPANNISETEAFINEAIQGLKNNFQLRLVILKRESQEFLGCAGLHDINRKDPELGIWIKKKAHGNKYGLEVITAIKSWADEKLDYEYLRYPVDKANIASRKIPEALGGEIVREFNKINMSGNTLHIVEYKINKTRN